MVNKANIMIMFVTLIFFTAGGSTTAMGRIIYVDSDAIGTYDGTSWAYGYRCLQDALSNVQPGDEVRVASGIYKPDQQTSIFRGRAGGEGEAEHRITASGDRTATFTLLSGVTIKGGYAGYGEPDPNVRDFVPYETILSGDLNADDIDVNYPWHLQEEPNRSENSYHVVITLGGGVLDGFTITGGNANGDVLTNEPSGRYDAPQINIDNNNGGGLFNQYGTPRISNCVFTSNSARNNGGGMYNDVGNPTIDNCAFSGNSARNNGGGMYNDVGNPTIDNCTFSSNSARNNGGGLYNKLDSSTIKNCTFSSNSADYGGGGMYNDNSNMIPNNCKFSENVARYGGAVYINESRITFIKCEFVGNSVNGYGGGIYSINNSSLILNNCVFNGNSARDCGGGISFNNSDSTLTNCTFKWNLAVAGAALAFNSQEQTGQSTVEISNCILWDLGEEIFINDRSTININYSNIRDSWPGIGNITADPLFEDQTGPDRIPCTQDDKLQLIPLSPCVDAGEPNYVPEPNETDLDGNRRIINGRIDMGAYEFQGWIYVEEDPTWEIWRGEPEIIPSENGTKTYPFDDIQEAIDIAKDGYTILVRPGRYNKIDYSGKAITVTGTEGAAVIEAWSRDPDADRDAVTFHTGEGPGSVLKNFIIRNSNIAISLNFSSPKIHNITIVNNSFGIAAYENSNPEIRNCIIWNNINGDLFQCEALYSCIESGIRGEGNISANPLFVDAANGDYHLKSEGWRWNTNNQSWTWDNVTSQCIDAGDPNWPLGDELMRTPRDPDNMYGINQRINIGAYGGTWQASMPPLGWLPLEPEEDTTPPMPNPTQWAPNGAPREVDKGDGTFDYWIEMEVREATDASGFVEYFFECTTLSSFSSGWQISPTYSVPVGRRGQGQRFRVKARDLYLNETEWSDERTAH